MSAQGVLPSGTPLMPDRRPSGTRSHGAPAVSCARQRAFPHTPPPMLVMKFGGTSVGDAARIRDVIEIVRGRLGRKPVVVVSAQAGVTNELIALAHSAAKSETSAADLRGRFERLLAELRLPADLVEEELDELDALLKGISLVGDLTPRSLDRMMSFGERCSARIVAAALTKAGIPAAAHMAYDVGLLTDSTYGAAIVEPSTYSQIPQRLDPAPAGGEVAVVTG